MTAEEKTSAAASPLPVSIDKARCVRMRHASASCSRCADACGSRAIEIRDGTLSLCPSKCTGCGACAAACPTDAAKLSEVFALPEAALASGAREKGTLRIACREAAEDEPGVRVRCLLALSPSLLLSLFTEGVRDIALVSGRCASCPGASPGALQALIAETEKAGAQAGFSPRITAGEKPRRGAIDLRRRFFFRRAAARAAAPEKEAGIPVLPDRSTFCNPAEDRLTHEVPASREKLIAALQALRPEAMPDGFDPYELPPVFLRPRIGSDCAGCAMCAAACPAGAIRQERAEGRLQLYARSGACVNCGLCTDLCFRNAVSLEPETLEQAVLGLETLEFEEIEETDESQGDWGLKMGGLFGNAPVHWT